jgi:hypothetical protein
MAITRDDQDAAFLLDHRAIPFPGLCGKSCLLVGISKMMPAFLSQVQPDLKRE